MCLYVQKKAIRKTADYKKCYLVTVSIFNTYCLT